MFEGVLSCFVVLLFCVWLLSQHDLSAKPQSCLPSCRLVKGEYGLCTQPLFCLVAAWPEVIRKHTETHVCFAMFRFVSVYFLSAHHNVISLYRSQMPVRHRIFELFFSDIMLFKSNGAISLNTTGSFTLSLPS